jgi:SulP family sulfate permease
MSKVLVFGGINAVATVPALIAYAAIVFKASRRPAGRPAAVPPPAGRPSGAASVWGTRPPPASTPALSLRSLQDPIYAPYLDLLCKFFFLSSAVHQAVFCLRSSLPFAIGQVQVRPRPQAQSQPPRPAATTHVL